MRIRGGSLDGLEGILLVHRLDKKLMVSVDTIGAVILYSVLGALEGIGFTIYPNV